MRSGIFVSPTNYHKHGAYLIENADMAGFTAREQKQMSKLVLGQKGNLMKIEWSADQHRCTESGCRAETGGHASACQR